MLRPVENQIVGSPTFYALQKIKVGDTYIHPRVYYPYYTLKYVSYSYQAAFELSHGRQVYNWEWPELRFIFSDSGYIALVKVIIEHSKSFRRALGPDVSEIEVIGILKVPRLPAEAYIKS